MIKLREHFVHIGFSALLNSRLWGLLFFVVFAVFLPHLFNSRVLLNNSASVDVQYFMYHVIIKCMSN